MSRRTEMLGSTIQRELAGIIMRELNDPRLTGMPSITRVKVSPDFSVADVYVTIMGTEGQQNATLNALRHSAGMMRSKLKRSLSTRVTPFLKFHIDENLKKELAIYALLDKVKQESAGEAGPVADAEPDADADAEAESAEPVSPEASQSELSEGSENSDAHPADPADVRAEARPDRPDESDPPN